MMSLNSPENFYVKYSVQGEKQSRSYIQQMTIRSVNYSFIAVDACITPGPKRPFDFFGNLDKNEIEKITGIVEKTRQSQSNYNIWFGHFPSSYILSETDQGIRDIIGRLKIIFNN